MTEGVGERDVSESHDATLAVHACRRAIRIALFRFVRKPAGTLNERGSTRVFDTLEGDLEPGGRQTRPGERVDAFGLDGYRRDRDRRAVDG